MSINSRTVLVGLLILLGVFTFAHVLYLIDSALIRISIALGGIYFGIDLFARKRLRVSTPAEEVTSSSLSAWFSKEKWTSEDLKQSKGRCATFLSQVEIDLTDDPKILPKDIEVFTFLSDVRLKLPEHFGELESLSLFSYAQLPDQNKNIFGKILLRGKQEGEDRIMIRCLAGVSRLECLSKE